MNCRPSEFFRLRVTRVLGFRFFAAFLLLQAPTYPLVANAATADTTAIAIDDGQFPIISISANHAPLADVLNQLSSRLGFAIERLPTDSHQTVTTTLRGELGDLLRSDALGRLNFLLIGSGSHLERLIFIGPEPRADTPPANAAAMPVTEPRRGPVQSAAAPAPFAAASTPAPTGSQVSAATFGRVTRLLRSQAMQGSAQAVSPLSPAAAPDQKAQPAAAAAATAPGDATVAATVRTALINVSTLSSALRSVCIGPTCGR